MTREEAKSCISTIEILQRLAYNIHGVMDVIDSDNCEKIIKALEQEPILDKIEPKCDRINSLASVLPYTAHREIQELLCEIMDLCKAESEDKE